MFGHQEFPAGWEAKATVYDLAKRPANWDFVLWAVNVRELGYTQINFDFERVPDDGKWLNKTKILERVLDFMWPVTLALGMKADWSGEGDRDVGSMHFYHLRPDFRRLVAPQVYNTGKHTVTIRDLPYKRYRNSDRDVWLTFAKKIGAIVIEEYDRRNLNFADRFAYYAGAPMNWGVTNGPLAAAFLTPYPIAMFCDPRNDSKGMLGLHINPGEQVQCALPNQNLVWGEITLENLLSYYERLTCKGMCLARMSCRYDRCPSPQA